MIYSVDTIYIGTFSVLIDLTISSGITGFVYTLIFALFYFEGPYFCPFELEGLILASSEIGFVELFKGKFIDPPVVLFLLAI